jgi:hypothetical protein
VTCAKAEWRISFVVSPAIVSGKVPRVKRAPRCGRTPFRPGLGAGGTTQSCELRTAHCAAHRLAETSIPCESPERAVSFFSTAHSKTKPDRPSRRHAARGPQWRSDVRGIAQSSISKCDLGDADLVECPSLPPSGTAEGDETSRKLGVGHCWLTFYNESPPPH